MEDEQVRKALARGCDRGNIIDVLDISQRTTFNTKKRACTYDFPLSAFNRGGKPTDGSHSEQPSDSADDDNDEQQRLDTVTEQIPDSVGDSETPEETESEPSTQSCDERQESGEQDGNDADEELREHLQQAIDALQEVDNALKV